MLFRAKLLKCEPFINIKFTIEITIPLQANFALGCNYWKTEQILWPITFPDKIIDLSKVSEAFNIKTEINWFLGNQLWNRKADIFHPRAKFQFWCSKILIVTRLTQPSIYRQLFVDEKRTICLAYGRQMSIVR